MRRRRRRTGSGDRRGRLLLRILCLPLQSSALGNLRRKGRIACLQLLLLLVLLFLGFRRVDRELRYLNLELADVVLHDRYPLLHLVQQPVLFCECFLCLREHGLQLLVRMRVCLADLLLCGPELLLLQTQGELVKLASGIVQVTFQLQHQHLDTLPINGGRLEHRAQLC